MPLKDDEARRAYMREWYARPENRQRTIAKVKARKYGEYAGVCLVCGGPTVGNGPGKAPSYCGRNKECRSASRKKRDES